MSPEPSREAAIRVLTEHLGKRQISRPDDANDFTSDMGVALPVYSSAHTQAQFVVTYLDAFGYFRGGLGKAYKVNLETVLDGVDRFQDYFGLERTRDLDTATIRAMEAPRCGCPDMVGKRTPEFLRVQAHAKASLARWKKTGLTYAVAKYLPGIAKAAQDAVFAEGFWKWCRLGNVDARRVDDVGAADIVIGTGRGPQSNFDGAGGVLAWAYLPNGRDGQLTMKFDLSERWLLTGPGRGHLVANVFAHEAGHLFGLSHSRAPGALMAPRYDAAIADPQPDDVEQFQKRYGKRKEPLPKPAQVLAVAADKTVVIEHAGRVRIVTDGDIHVVGGHAEAEVLLAPPRSDEED